MDFDRHQDNRGSSSELYTSTHRIDPGLSSKQFATTQDIGLTSACHQDNATEHQTDTGSSSYVILLTIVYTEQHLSHYVILSWHN